MIMALGLGDGKADRHHVEVRRVGGGEGAEIAADAELEFIGADAQRTVREQRLVGPAVSIGDRRFERARALAPTS